MKSSSGIKVPVNTPSTSETSSTTGEEALEVLQEKVAEAVKAATVPVLRLPRPVKVGEGGIGRRKGGNARSRRSGVGRKETGGGVDAKERMRG